MVAASIITIGDELLIGQVIDSNSAWMAQELNKAGLTVKRRVAVGDNAPDIRKALDDESAVSEIILITGGLGPTADDITKPLLCEYFGGKMIVNQEALENVKHLFTQVFKRPVTEINLKQAEVPDNCTVILNGRGTAPGMWFERNDRVFVSMPGVPHEMKGMMTDGVIPKLKERFQLGDVYHRTVLTAGIGESAIAEMLTGFEQKLPNDIRLAYLPAYGMVRLRLTGIAKDERLHESLNRLFDELKQIVKTYLVTDEDEPLAKVILRLLEQNKGTLATAESCTGGYIAHQITQLPGASAVYKGGVVSYSDELKQMLLSVPSVTISEHGAVSEPTVIAMAKGAIEKLGSDYSIAVSGIMGPTGGTAEKPVGTVWMAVANNKEVVTHKLQLRFERKMNIEVTAMQALLLLRKLILQQQKA
jgi:nicotinamide-nucleotide amidase